MSTPSPVTQTPLSPRTMRAARVHQFGPPDVLKIEEIPVPQPTAGEVLVRVRAAGVGPWDGWVRAGKSALPQPLPLTPGADVSGVVVDAGDKNGDLAVSDAIYGVTNARFTGGYAEYAIANAMMVARKPARLSGIEAASVPVVAVTALQMLFRHAALGNGTTVFIHGAAGNVGAYAVQLARLEGIRVLASARPTDQDYVLGMGAESVFDPTSADAHRFLQSCDAAIDTVGGETQRALFALVKKGGSLVSSVAQPDQQRAQEAEIESRFILVDVNRTDLERLTKLFDAGKIVTQIGTVLPLDQVRQSHEMLEGVRPRPRGKIVLDIA